MVSNVFYQMLMGLHLGAKIPAEGRYNNVRFYLVEKNNDIVFLHVVVIKLLIVFKRISGTAIGAIGIVVIAELLI